VKKSILIVLLISIFLMQILPINVVGEDTEETEEYYVKISKITPTPSATLIGKSVTFQVEVNYNLWRYAGDVTVDSWDIEVILYVYSIGAKALVNYTSTITLPPTSGDSWNGIAVLEVSLESLPKWTRELRFDAEAHLWTNNVKEEFAHYQDEAYFDLGYREPSISIKEIRVEPGAADETYQGFVIPGHIYNFYIDVEYDLGSTYDAKVGADIFFDDLSKKDTRWGVTDYILHTVYNDENTSITFVFPNTLIPNYNPSVVNMTAIKVWVILYAHARENPEDIKEIPVKVEIERSISIKSILVCDAEGFDQGFVIPGLGHNFDIEIEYDLKIGDEGYVQIQVLSNGEVIKSERITVHNRNNTVSVYVSSCNIPEDAARVDIKVILFSEGMGIEESNVYDVKTVPVNVEHPEISQILFTPLKYLLPEFEHKLNVPPYTIFLYPSAWKHKFRTFEFEISVSVTQRSKIRDVYAEIKTLDSDEVVMLTKLLDLDEDGIYEGTYEVSHTVESFQSQWGKTAFGNNYVLEISVIELNGIVTTARLDHRIIIEDVPVAEIEFTKGEVSIDRGSRENWMDKSRENWLYRGDIVQLGAPMTATSPPYQGVSEIKIHWLLQGVKGIARLDPSKPDVEMLCDKFIIGATREASGWPMPLSSVLFTQTKEQAKSQAIEWFVTKILKVPAKVFGAVSMVLTIAPTLGRSPIIYINLESEILIEPNPDGTLRILVFEGSPEVFYDYGNSSILLNSGEMTVIAEDNVPSNPVAFDPETVDKWWEEIGVSRIAILEHALCKQLDENGDPVEMSSVFVAEESVISWLSVVNASEGDEIRWFFKGPNEIMKEIPYTLEWDGEGYCCAMLDLNNYDSVGDWTVTVYVNGEDVLTQQFTVDEGAEEELLLNILLGFLILIAPIIIIALVIRRLIKRRSKK